MIVVETSPRAPDLRPLSTGCSTEICSVAMPHLPALSAHRRRVLAITHVESAPPGGAAAGSAYALLHPAATVLASIRSSRNDFSGERRNLRLVQCIGTAES